MTKSIWRELSIVKPLNTAILCKRPELNSGFSINRFYTKVGAKSIKTKEWLDLDQLLSDHTALTSQVESLREALEKIAEYIDIDNPAPSNESLIARDALQAFAASDNNGEG